MRSWSIFAEKYLCSSNNTFSKLKAYANQHENIMLSAVEFDHDNLKPTFRYIENSIGSSNAIETAKDLASMMK